MDSGNNSNMVSGRSTARKQDQVDPAQMMEMVDTLKVLLSDERAFEYVSNWIFEKIDVSGDGLISTDEIKDFTEN